MMCIRHVYTYNAQANKRMQISWGEEEVCIQVRLEVCGED